MSLTSAFRLWCIAGALALCATTALAQEAAPADAPEAPSEAASEELDPALYAEYLHQTYPGVKFQQGPTTAQLGSVAEIKVPKGFAFVDQASVRAFNDLMQNDTSPNDLGVMLSPPSDDGSWFVSFTYNDSGYVKDDEKDQINAQFATDALKSFREGQEQDNDMRRSKGWPELTLSGWEPAPFYDPQTNNLTWGLIVDQKNGEQGESTINYQSRLLGRRGYMSATLVMGRSQAGEAIPAYKQLLTGYTYKSGQKYAEFKSGDKIAEYGLTALVGAGVVAAAAKSGILGKLLKPLIVGVLIVGGAISSFFKSIFGRKSEPGEAQA